MSRSRNGFSTRRSLCFALTNSLNEMNEDVIRLPHATQVFGRYLGCENSSQVYDTLINGPIISSGVFSAEVTEAACSCMIAQLDEAKQRSISPVTQELVVLEEFGRCLDQILESAAKLTMAYPTEASYRSNDVGQHPQFVAVFQNQQEATDGALVGQTGGIDTEGVRSVPFRPSQFADTDAEMACYPVGMVAEYRDQCTYLDRLEETSCEMTQVPVPEPHALSIQHVVRNTHRSELIPDVDLEAYELVAPQRMCFPFSEIQYSQNQLNQDMAGQSKEQVAAYVSNFVTDSQYFQGNLPSHAYGNEELNHSTSVQVVMLPSGDYSVDSNALNYSLDQSYQTMFVDQSNSENVPPCSGMMSRQKLACQSENSRMKALEDEEVQNATAALLNVSKDSESHGFSISGHIDLDERVEMNEAVMATNIIPFRDSTSTVMLSPKDLRNFECHTAINHNQFHPCNLNLHTESAPYEGGLSIKSDTPFYAF